MRPFRFLSVWLAIDLCVKFVAMPAIGAVTDSTTLVGFGPVILSAPLAYGVLRRRPELDTDALWYGAGAVFVLGVAGHAAVALTVGRTPIRESGIGVVALALAAVIARERWFDADPSAPDAAA